MHLRRRAPMPEKLHSRVDDLSKDAKIKSFRCSFCKRCFSNAQALGGHMNIHRKHRAKLKEFSDDNFLSLDIAKSVEFFARDEEAKKPAAPDDVCRDLLVLRCKHDSVRNLALFAVSEKNKMELIKGGLDLELRLGLQPHHEAKIKHY